MGLSGIKNLPLVDTRRQGGGLRPDSLFTASEQAGQCWDIGSYDGIHYPGGGCYFAEIPVEVFEGAGGDFKMDEVREVVERHTALGVYPVIHVYGVDPAVTEVESGDGSITIYWSHSNPDIFYKVFVSKSLMGPWTPVLSGGSETISEDITENRCVISGLENGTTYYIRVVGGTGEGDAWLGLCGQVVKPLSCGVDNEFSLNIIAAKPGLPRATNLFSQQFNVFADLVWTEQANPGNSLLYSVAYGNGLFVAVGDTDGVDAYIITSPDGVVWTEQVNPKSSSLYDVSYGNGLWVAVGDTDGVDAYIVTSPDGVVWTEQVNPKSFDLDGIAYGNGLWVAGGDTDGVDAYIVTSPDGVVWTEQANPKSIGLLDVAYGNGIWVAVGDTDGVDAYVITSPDGAVWTEQVNPKNITLNSASYGNGLWVAVGDAGGIEDAYIITSPDGVVWTEQVNPKSSSLYDVSCGNGLRVAVGTNDGTDAYVAMSSNEAVWLEETNPKDTALYGVVYGNGLWVAVGDSDGVDAYIITSGA